MKKKPRHKDSSALEPVGARFLWTVATSLIVGVAICIAGLATAPSGWEWAIISCLAGLGSAGVAATTLVDLAAQRRRVLFEAERAVADLNRMTDRLSVEVRGSGRERDRRRLVGEGEGLPPRWDEELALRRARASRYRAALIRAEAYDQASGLDDAIAEADELREDIEPR